MSLMKKKMSFHFLFSPIFWYSPTHVRASQNRTLAKRCALPAHASMGRLLRKKAEIPKRNSCGVLGGRTFHRKYPRIMRTFSTKILTSKRGGGAHYIWVYLYMCGYVEKYHICGLKVGVRILHGYLRYSQMSAMNCTYRGKKYAHNASGLLLILVVLTYILCPTGQKYKCTVYNFLYKSVCSDCKFL